MAKPRLIGPVVMDSSGRFWTATSDGKVWVLCRMTDGPAAAWSSENGETLSRGSDSPGRWFRRLREWRKSMTAYHARVAARQHLNPIPDEWLEALPPLPNGLDPRAFPDEAADKES